MAVVVTTEGSRTEHASGVKWVVDPERNLVVLGSNSKAVAIYERDNWSAAEVTE